MRSGPNPAPLVAQAEHQHADNAHAELAWMPCPARAAHHQDDDCVSQHGDWIVAWFVASSSFLTGLVFIFSR
jgi:hypothetical protein